MLTLRSLSRWFVVALALGAFIPVACDDTGRIEIILPPGGLKDGGSQPDALTTDGSMSDDGGDADAGNEDAFPVLVAVTPNPRGDGPVSVADVVDARLTALAAGSRGMVIRRTPAELLVDGAWSKLESEALVYGKNGTTISFVFSIVDGMASGVDEAFSSLSWDDPNLMAAMHDRIDQIFVRLAGYAPIFIIGRDVDVFLAAHPEQREPLETLLLDLIVHARTNEFAPPNTRVGVGFSFAGINSNDPSFPLIHEDSDLTVVSYLPGLGMEMVGPVSNVATDADVLVERSAGKPIVLEALGYPTSELVGGSAVQQAFFLETFFTVLAPRRASFAFVNVDFLHDLGPERCAARALSAGQLPDGAWASYTCSLGLFDADGQAKAAWPVFVGGAAAFASP